MLATLSFRYGGHPRRVRIHAPSAPGPLLVLFDGQNVFGDDGSYAGGWHADAAVDRLASTVRRPIVVGVDHGGLQRIHELHRDLDPFLGFLRDEVLPAIRDRWETDPSSTVLGGSSMGGIAALLGHFREPHTWTAALAMSPSLWVGRGAALRELDRRPVPPGSRIYLDVGNRERGSMPRHALRLAQELARRGYGPRDLLWRPDERGTHQERHWRRRLPKALRFLFRR